MLTLTRKVGESIRIGDDIEIVVKEIRRNQVRIGIVAPRDVAIYREEVARAAVRGQGPEVERAVGAQRYGVGTGADAEGRDAGLDGSRGAGLLFMIGRNGQVGAGARLQRREVRMPRDGRGGQHKAALGHAGQAGTDVGRGPGWHLPEDRRKVGKVRGSRHLEEAHQRRIAV